MSLEGDPRLYSTGSGSDIVVANGQPEMDEGLENAVYISLFSSPGWWGNEVSSEAEKLGSEFETIARRTLTNAARIDAEEYARGALAWMLDAGAASLIEVSATIPSVGMLGLEILIARPAGDVVLRYEVNWQTMEARTR